MIRQAEEPTRDAIPEPVISGYRLEDSPRRREGGSLLFSALAHDGGRVSVQVAAEPAANRRVRARFRRLARSRAELEHPGLLGVREVGEEQGRPFIAAERFPLRSLADVLRDAPVRPATALALLTPVADALDAAHAAGLAHRTLSPESVLLDGDLPKLDLFGLFGIVGSAVWGGVVRSDAPLHYESPEAARGDEPDSASNVYSLTALLFHALTGRQPFAHYDPMMIAYAHASQTPPKPSELNAALPAALDRVVERGMAKEPDERPKSAGALIASAAELLRTAEPAPAPKLAKETPPRPVARTPTQSAPPPAATQAASADAPRPWVAVAAPAAAASELERPDWRRPPLRARLTPWWPVLLVALVAATFGALLGMPGGDSGQTAVTARSAQGIAVKHLDGVRHRLRDELAFAPTASEQADVADRLAVAYGRAADVLRSRELVSAARDASAAYASLAQAAREGDEDAFETARGDVEAAESEIGRR